MTPKLDANSHKDPPGSKNSLRPAVLIIGLLILVGTIGAYIVLHLSSRRDGRAEQNPANHSKSQAGRSVDSKRQPAASSKSQASVHSGGTETQVGSRPATIIRRDSSPLTRELVARLSEFDLRRGISPDQAEAWKKNLSSLLASGVEAIPAIRDFLEKNLDYDYRAVKGGAQLGEPSLRIALLHVLEQVGGPEAVDVMAQTLRTTADPVEIASLARSLEHIAPDQFLPVAVNAAREVLNMASKGDLKNVDVAPLFEMLQKYGDESTVRELSGASAHWNYYATMALADLPEGTGIPALMQMTHDPKAAKSGSDEVALRLLAQLTLDYPDVQKFLLQEARSNQIPAWAWQQIGLGLSGEKLEYAQNVFSNATTSTDSAVRQAHYVAFGNQHFATISSIASLTQDQIRSQIQLIDGLLSTTSLPAAQSALLTAKTNLSRRLRQ